MSLDPLGWAEPFESALQSLLVDQPELEAARVCSAHRGGYVLRCAGGSAMATLGGRLRHEARDDSDLPAVGDWVAVRSSGDASALIVALLPRRSVLVRQRPDRPTTPQVLAANLDSVFIVCALNQDFNPRRLERYLSMIWESGAAPVVLLNKADLCPDVAALRERAIEVAPGASVHVLSAASGDGLDALQGYLKPRTTVALVGSSGVGKSTIANALLGEATIATGEIREADGRGRHTTTQRQLITLPSGAMLIDTPGMRELGLWDAGDGVQATFEDVEALARGCRFDDCAHLSEPGCALQAALQSGQLSEARFQSYLKLQRELAYVERRRDERAQREHDQSMRRIWGARRREMRKHAKR